MPYLFTNRKHLAFPTASALVSAFPQDLRELGLSEEAIDEGHRDFMGPGVVDRNDWAISLVVNPTTGAVSTTSPFGGPVWVPDPFISGALMRGVHVPAPLEAITPGALPAEGKYVPAVLEAKGTTWGGDVTLTVKVGTAKATEAEAFASMPARDADKAQVFFFVLTRTAGSYGAIWNTGMAQEAPSAGSSSPRTVGTQTEVPKFVSAETEVEPNANRPVIVQATFVAAEGSAGGQATKAQKVRVFVGGVELFEPNGIIVKDGADNAGGHFNSALTFFVPAATKWKWTSTVEENGGLTVVCSVTYARL